MQVIPKSEAVLEKPLNLTVLEGLDAVFSCKTQKPLTHLISWFRDQCCKSFLAITDDNGFLKNGPSLPLIRLFSSFQTNITILTTDKSVSAVYSTGIQTHDLWNTSLLPSPLDQGSRPLMTMLITSKFSMGHLRILMSWLQEAVSSVPIRCMYSLINALNLHQTWSIVYPLQHHQLWRKSNFYYLLVPGWQKMIKSWWRKDRKHSGFQMSLKMIRWPWYKTSFSKYLR